MRPPMTITIPGTFDRRLATNTMKGRGWQASHAAKKDLKDRAWYALKEQGGSMTDPENCFQKDQWPLVIDYRVYYERHNEDGSLRRTFDDDNLLPVFKCVRDEIADFLGMSDRNMKTGEIEQHLWSKHKGEARIEVVIAPGDWWVRVAKPDYEKLCEAASILKGDRT